MIYGNDILLDLNEKFMRVSLELLKT